MLSKSTNCKEVLQFQSFADKTITKGESFLVISHFSLLVRNVYENWSLWAMGGLLLLLLLPLRFQLHSLDRTDFPEPPLA